MDPIVAARERLEQVTGLPALLEAAYGAFEHMLSVIEGLQDPRGEGFAAFVMSGVSAASGRDAVASAPSLPPASSADAARPASALLPADASVRDTACALARLSNLLADRLSGAAASAADIGDRDACAQASGHASDICSLMGGAPGR